MHRSRCVKSDLAANQIGTLILAILAVDHLSRWAPGRGRGELIPFQTVAGGFGVMSAGSPPAQSNEADFVSKKAILSLSQLSR